MMEFVGVPGASATHVGVNMMAAASALPPMPLLHPAPQQQLVPGGMYGFSSATTARKSTFNCFLSLLATNIHVFVTELDICWSGCCWRWACGPQSGLSGRGCELRLGMIERCGLPLAVRQCGRSPHNAASDSCQRLVAPPAPPKCPRRTITRPTRAISAHAHGSPRSLKQKKRPSNGARAFKAIGRRDCAGSFVVERYGAAASFFPRGPRPHCVGRRWLSARDIR